MSDWRVLVNETLQQVNNKSIFQWIFFSSEFPLAIKHYSREHKCCEYGGRHWAHYWPLAWCVRQCKTIAHPSLGSTSGTAGLQPSALRVWGGGWGLGGCLIPSGGSRVSGCFLPQPVHPESHWPGCTGSVAMEMFSRHHTVGGRRSFILGASPALFHMMWGYRWGSPLEHNGGIRIE